MSAFLVCLYVDSISQEITNNATIENAFAGQMNTEDLSSMKQGVYYLGNGQMKAIRIGSGASSDFDEMESEMHQRMKDYSARYKISYRVLTTEKTPAGIGFYPRLVITYEIFQTNGLPYVSPREKTQSRDALIAELKKLKELVDLEILTDEEFQNQAKPIKEKIKNLSF
jgi:hypothetical protein